MAHSIRVMEREDVEAVGRLLDKVFGAHSPLYSKWQKFIEWMYFSPAIKDQIPRALVIASERSVVGHVGLTLSEFTDGERFLKVVHTGNWVADPDSKVGVLSVRLLLDATSLGDVAIIIGGTDETQRILPKIGYKKQLEIDRFIKVIRPKQYLSLSRSGKQLVRNTGKLMICLAKSPLNTMSVRNRNPRADFQIVDSNNQNNTDSLDYNAGIISSTPGRVLRNTLNADFINWYRQCPQGNVHVLRFFSEGSVLTGQATTYIQTRKGHRYANLVNVDTYTDDPSAWGEILNATEHFLRGEGVTHINTLATYIPLCQALKDRGYCRVNRLPVWILDKNNKLAGVEAWHMTVIDGDLGYLFE